MPNWMKELAAGIGVFTVATLCGWGLYQGYGAIVDSGYEQAELDLGSKVSTAQRKLAESTAKANKLEGELKTANRELGELKDANATLAASASFKQVFRIAIEQLRDPKAMIGNKKLVTLTKGGATIKTGDDWRDEAKFVYVRNADGDVVDIKPEGEVLEGAKLDSNLTNVR